jgi:branched-subunit amino acid aminotransferase/4-amino-4-deoxychorismate lyase
VSPAMLYGRGVFTTVAIYDSRPFLWHKHWQRLNAHAERIGLSVSGLREKNVAEPLQNLIAVNQVETGWAKVILLARNGEETSGTGASGSKKIDLLIMTGDAHKVAETGLSLAVSPYRINTFSPLAGIKSLNYLDHVLSWEEARKRDFDEAVMLNERGEIVSATQANIFWTLNGTLHTPALSSGAIAGITRECVIGIAARHFIPLLEGVYEIQDLAEADEIFLTSSEVGVAPVTTFDFRRYSVEASSITTLVRKAFSKLLAEVH